MDTNNKENTNLEKQKNYEKILKNMKKLAQKSSDVKYHRDTDNLDFDER